MCRAFIGPAFLTVMLAGCATGGTPHDGTKSSYDAQLDAYLDCNVAASRALSKQRDGASSLAVAARSQCAREELALSEAVYASSVSVHTAERMMDNFRKRVVEANIGWIVQYRARSAGRS